MQELAESHRIREEAREREDAPAAFGSRGEVVREGIGGGSADDGMTVERTEEIAPQSTRYVPTTIHQRRLTRFLQKHQPQRALSIKPPHPTTNPHERNPPNTRHRDRRDCRLSRSKTTDVFIDERSFFVAFCRIDT